MLLPHTHPADEEEEEEGFRLFFVSRFVFQVSSGDFPRPGCVSHTWGSSGVLTGRCLQVSWSSPGKSSSSSPRICHAEEAEQAEQVWMESITQTSCVSSAKTLDFSPSSRTCTALQTWTDVVDYILFIIFRLYLTSIKDAGRGKLWNGSIFNDFVTDLCLYFV